MQSIVRLGLTVVAVLVFGAAVTSGAFAEEFVASKTGKLKGKSLSTQEFKTGTGATMDCSEVTVGGEVTKLKATELTLTEFVGNCTISGIGKATFSANELTTYTPRGFRGLKPEIIKALALGVECELEVKSESELGTGSEEMSYKNKGGVIEVTNKVTKIAIEILKSNSVSLCGSAHEKKEGTYQGKGELELEGGTLEVK